VSPDPGFAAILARGFQPYAFGRAESLAALDLAAFGLDVLPLRADTPASTRFHTLLNRLNAVAFGGMAMPPWVQLDCGVLPSAFIGFAARTDQLTPALAAELGASPDDGWVPVSEALAIPSLTPGEVISISLASVVPGLGYATKRLGLRCLRARTAIGVTQRGSRAARVHARFGPLEIVADRAPFHDRADETFIYRIRLPDP
jgi:hypothetical protein